MSVQIPTAGWRTPTASRRRQGGGEGVCTGSRGWMALYALLAGMAALGGLPLQLEGLVEIGLL